MKSYHCLLITTLSLLAVFADIGPGSSAPAAIHKITTRDGELNTRIILETDAAPTLVRSFCTAKAIILEFDHVNPSVDLPIETPEKRSVTGIQLEKTGAEAARLRIQVQELIPYTMRSLDGTTVIELNRIQRGDVEIPVEPEVLKRLEQSSGSNAFMTKLNVEEQAGRLRFWAKLSGETVQQVFTLENPLRLVIDVYDAVYEAGSSALAVGRFGLRRVRVSQFRLNSPRCIARMVFDLDEPGYYDLRSDASEISVSFFKE
jgi:type IV pilus assembly protein PilQ